MRKRKICSLLLVILFIASFPATFYMDVSSIRGANHTDTNRINIEAPRENIHVGSSSKAAFSRTITIKFPEPMIVKNKKLGEYVWFKMHGCRYIATPGHPALPIKVITVKLDRDSTVFGVHVKVTERKLKGTYNVIPAFKPHPLNSEVKKYISKPDPKIYGSKSWYPDKWYSYRIYRGLDPETMSRVKYLVVYFYPLRYKPAEGYMIRAEKAEITITYSGAAEEKHPASAIDLAIITSPLLEEEAVLLAKWKNETGISSIVVNTEWIYQNYPGVDEPEKIRNYIKDAVDNLGIKFVLIFGDADQVPVRYAWIPDGYDDTGDFDGSVVETDLYYADLDYSWDDNGDGRWGDLGNDTVDGIPDVYVGRLPASTVDEASILINKIKNYDPLNEWFMRYLLLGTDMFGGREGEILKDYIQSNLLWSNFSYTKLYETAGTLTVENAMTKIDEGYGFINFAGHGNYYFWSFGEGGVYYDANASSQVNGNLSVIFTTSCLTARFSDRDCIGEAFLLNPEGGGIAYCGASRVTWGYAGEHIIDGLSGEIDWRFTEAFFNCLNQSSSMEPYAGVVWAIALTKYAMNHPLNTEYGGYFLDWKTIAEYGTLLGDPTLCIKGRGSPPPPPPPSKLYGYVHDLNGNPVGNAIVQVYNYSSGVLYGQNTTDSSGYYEIYISNSGYMYMQVNASGYYPYRSTHFYYSTGVDTQKNITLTAFFSPAVDILLVVDDDAKYCLDEGVWPDEIRSPLETAGYVVHVWNESIQGLPCLDALLDVDAVFWHTGTMWYYAVDPVDAATLIQYVQSGGNLVLEGEDIGWDHEADEFMINVAHAIYEVDDAAVESFEITYPLHPVVTNLPSTFSFTTKPSYPDGVEPTNGGLEVIRYKDTKYTAVTVYDGRSKSEGRVVYMAFPIHYIGQSERQTLLLNSIGWATSQYLVKVSTNKRVYISNEDIKVVANITVNGSAVTGAEVTAYIYDPDGNEVASLSLHDDGTGGDETPNDGIYTGIHPGLPNSFTHGRYRLIATANIMDYINEINETSFLFVGDDNLLVEVYNAYNEQAPYAYINVIDQSTGSIVRFWYETDENGIYCTNLPNGTYAVMAWSGWGYRLHSERTDTFFILEKNIQVIKGNVTAVQLNASTGISLTIQTYNIKSEPQEYFWIDFYPSIGGFGLDVALTDSDGQAIIYVTPEKYHIAARCHHGNINYYLYMLNVSCTSSNTVTFQPTPETTSNLTLSFHKVAKEQHGWAYIHAKSLPSPFGFGFYSCNEVIVTTDEWDVWGAYTYIRLKNGYWSCHLWCEPARTFNLTIPGSAATFNYGGPLQFMLSVNGSYSPGDTVQIFWNLTDSYGNVVDSIREGTEHISKLAIMAKIHGEDVIFTESGRVKPLAYQEHYPYLTILDPDGSPIVTTDVYWYEKPKQYTLSDDAENGTYTVKMTINTGPYQGVITVSDVFTVGKATPKISDVSIVNAPANTVYFIFADPAYMTRAEATYDVASGSCIYGLCTNPQHMGFNTTKDWLLPSGAVNTTTISGSIVAMFGGPSPHVAVRYYEKAGLSPVKFASNATHCMFLNQTGDVVAALPISSLISGHEDMFVIEVFTDGTNTFFVAYGFEWKGTWAGGIYYKEVILPNISNYHKSYYIFHWIDESGDGIPQSSEIFEEASG